MRARLTLAMITLVAGTLAVAASGSLLLIRSASIRTAQSELTSEAQALSTELTTAFPLPAAAGGSSGGSSGRTTPNPRGVLRALLAVIAKVGSYQTLAVVGMTPQGSFDLSTGQVDGAPIAIPARLVDANQVLSGNTVVGNVGHTVFAVVPLELDAQRMKAAGIPATEAPVLVLTRQVGNQINGLAYFVLVASLAFVVAAAVAAYLARRISSPLVHAVATTQRIAAGDLEAKVPVQAHDYPELARLASAINAMGDGLSRSKETERQFLLSVSHELRTPLTSIRGYAEAIADGATDDVPGALAVIGSEARRLERLVSDLLDLARLDASRFSLHMERVDAAQVARSVAAGFARQASELGLFLVLDPLPPQEHGMWVDADRDRLAQMVANLVENAFKFAQHTVTVGAGIIGSSCALWVADDGPGISPEDLPHVFERHFRSDRKPSRTVGTGLGLAIVSELAAGMGAVVRAQSPVLDGRGTRMEIWFAPRPAPSQ